MKKGKVLLKGMVASAGVARGRVRVISGHEEAGRVLKGEVLVTVMTDPRLTPAIKRAVAVVTDTGGLLCHAAITTREFKKPCVVATKKATEILKDGQLVVVDAVKGEVYEA